MAVHVELSRCRCVWQHECHYKCLHVSLIENAINATCSDLHQIAAKFSHNNCSCRRSAACNTAQWRSILWTYGAYAQPPPQLCTRTLDWLHEWMSMGAEQMQHLLITLLIMNITNTIYTDNAREKQFRCCTACTCVCCKCVCVRV